MIRKRIGFIIKLYALLDVAIIAGAFMAAYGVRYEIHALYVDPCR